MTWLAALRAIPAILRSLFGPFMFLLGSRSAKKDERRKRAEADVKAMKTRQEIDDDVQQDTDLVDRARKSGVLRRGK